MEVRSLINFTLAVIFMQFPIVILLIIFSRHALISLKLDRFRLIYWGWIVNLFYLGITAIMYYNELPEKTLNKNTAIGLSLLEFCLDFTYIFIFFLAIVPTFEIFKRIASKIKLSSIFIVLFSFGTLRCFLLSDKMDVTLEILTQIPFVIFYIFVLFHLALYFKKFDNEYNGRLSYLSIGVFIYASSQFLIVFKGMTEHLKILYSTGFTIGLVSKSFITYGLHRLFVFYAEENKAKEVITSKLDKIIGRTFHELVIPMINLEKHITKLLNPKDQNIQFNHKAKKQIDLIEMNFSKAYAIYTAQKELYNWRIHEKTAVEGMKLKKFEDESRNRSINSLLEISRLTLRNFLGEKVTFIAEYSSNCNLYCNPNEIIQIFDNLLKNSYNAFPSGEGTIILKTKLATLEGQPNKVIKVEIIDNGEGIAKEVRNTMFEDGVTTREGPGRGLGLSLVKEYVDKYNGQIIPISPFQNSKFKNNLGGTNMTLIFPQKENLV